MNKEQYLKESKEKIDRMPVEQLRNYCWTIDRNSQSYFESWQNCEEKIKQLEIELFNKTCEVEELEEKNKTLKDTCVELSKRATYTDEEKEKYWEFECDCGFTGYSIFVLGGTQIADTGDYGNCYCPCCGDVLD